VRLETLRDRQCWVVDLCPDTDFLSLEGWNLFLTRPSLANQRKGTVLWSEAVRKIPEKMPHVAVAVLCESKVLFIRYDRGRVQTDSEYKLATPFIYL